MWDVGNTSLLLNNIDNYEKMGQTDISDLENDLSNYSINPSLGI